MKEQLKDIDPSAKEPLFRRVMGDKRLAYLREGKGIIGFELDLSKQQRLSGFLLVGIQKHTTYVYRSDLDEEPRLVLFPSLDKLFDNDFEMLGLYVIKKLFSEATFNGKVLGTGRLDTLVADLTPPEKEVDVPEGVSEQMLEHMRKIHAQGMTLTQETNTAHEHVSEHKTTPSQEVSQEDAPIQEDVAGYDDFEETSYDSFDEGVDDDYDEGYDDTEDAMIDDTPSPLVYESPVEDDVDDEAATPVVDVAVDTAVVEDERTIKLKEQTFGSLVEVGDFATLRLGVAKAISTQVVNKALQSNVDANYRIELAVLLFSKLFNDKKI